jgi:hypothetical protein
MNPATEIVTHHFVLGIVLVLNTSIVKAFNEGTLKLPTYAVGLRVGLVLTLTAIGTVIDQVMNGTDFAAAAAGVAVVALPAIINELIHFFFGGWNDKGGGGKESTEELVAKKLSSRPPPIVPPPLACLVLALSLVALPGCAAMQKVPGVISAIATEILTDAQSAKQIVDTLNSTTNIYFIMNPNPAAQAKVEQAFADLNLAIDVAIRASSGAKDAVGSDYNSAFEKFRAAYASAQKLLQDLGVVGAPAGGKMAVARGGGGTQELPEPRAARLRAN